MGRGDKQIAWRDLTNRDSIVGVCEVGRVPFNPKRVEAPLVIEKHQLFPVSREADVRTARQESVDPRRSALLSADDEESGEPHAGAILAGAAPVRNLGGHAETPRNGARVGRFHWCAHHANILIYSDNYGFHRRRLGRRPSGMAVSGGASAEMRNARLPIHLSERICRWRIVHLTVGGP